MTGKVLPITIDELQTALVEADPPTPDDVSVALDGRRLDLREAALAWCAQRPGHLLLKLPLKRHSSVGLRGFEPPTS